MITTGKWVAPLALEQALAREQTLRQDDKRSVTLAVCQAAGFGIAIGATLALVPSLPVAPWMIGLIGTLVLIPVLAARPYRRTKERGVILAGFGDVRWQVEQALEDSDLSRVNDAIRSLEDVGSRNALVRELRESCLPNLERAAIEIRRARVIGQLRDDAIEFESRCRVRLDGMIKNAPVVRALKEIRQSSEQLEQRRILLQERWEEAYRSFSWWNKMKYGTRPDFTAIDAVLRELAVAQGRLERKHGAELGKLEAFVDQAKRSVPLRLEAARAAAESSIVRAGTEEASSSGLLEKAFWLSALSVPYSAWMDVDRAAGVYNTLRDVSGRFAALSDSEIWFQTLIMPASSLAGLSSLVKGAYFERLVALDTGGELHEHFNHPDTDITIDGVAFQVKATDREGYVAEVDDAIPVIATTEIATVSGDIDGGYTDVELTETIDLALGGLIVDASDTGVDAVLAGLGGLGVLASLAGLRHAVIRYENGGDPVEAAFAGAGVAVERTARSVVGAAELGYNALTSRPSRAVGRGIYKSGTWILNRL